MIKLIVWRLIYFISHVECCFTFIEYVETHVFEKKNDKFSFTKEYLKTSDRNGFSFIGIANTQNVDFQFYIPKEIENDNKVIISSFDCEIVITKYHIYV